MIVRLLEGPTIMIIGAGDKPKRGQSLVELALLLPILLLLVLGILDFGRSYYYYVSITNAAREGARYATLNPSGNVATHVSQELGPDIAINSGDVQVVKSSTPGQPDQVKVTVAYHFELVAGVFWSTVLGWSNPMTISSSASMPVTASP
jgi:Flp pilus assembly protein TadG